jgi:hypothetical protein
MKDKRHFDAVMIRERFSRKQSGTTISTLANDLVIRHPVDQETLDRWALAGCKAAHCGPVHWLPQSVFLNLH